MLRRRHHARERYDESRQYRFVHIESSKLFDLENVVGTPYYIRLHSEPESIAIYNLCKDLIHE